MTALGPEIDAWRRRADAFRWEVPDAFNFGRDVVDRYAAEPGRPALRFRPVLAEPEPDARARSEGSERASGLQRSLVRGLGMVAGLVVLGLLILFWLPIGF